MPHAAQVIAIMRLLGMGNFKKEPVLTNQLVEVLTGQGKSLIMAVASATLALLGADCYCACYSEYLSKRDFDDFKSLFQHLGVLEKVHYGTMEQLCESVINQRGSIRD
jgi:preprotein translocase subunit SecA